MLNLVHSFPGILSRKKREHLVDHLREAEEEAYSFDRIYEERFGNKPIDKSAATVRFEGFLFGFPPCCVDKYIKKPYDKNTIAEQEQKILFHWACKNCKISPILLPVYENIYKSLKNI